MDNLEAYIESVRQKYHLPALAIAVHREGQPDDVAAVGVRKADDPNNHVTKDDQFHFGSAGKAVTAAVIHKLVEKGQLKLDDTLADIFPDAPTWQFWRTDSSLHEKYKSVTIADLLTHSAGLPNIPGHPPSMETAALAQASTLPAMKKQLAEAPEFERGTHQYSNFGYTLLGKIAEQKSGKAYEQLVREEIFEPLGMKSAGFGIPASTNAPWGHQDNKPSREDGAPKEVVATGGMHASVGDWLKFVKWEMTQPRVQNPNQVVAFKRPGEEGEYTDSALRRKDGVLYHGGSNGFNMAKQVMLPDQKTSFVIVTNEANDKAIQAVKEVEERIKFEAFLESVRQKYNLPALAIAVSQEGQPDITAAVGVRNANEPDNHVSENDQFHFGSCGKAITAAIIHNRIKKGELKLDDTLGKLFPDVKLHEKYKNATIAQLLTHSAGTPEMPGPEPTPELIAEMQANPTGSTLEKMLEPASKLSAMKKQLEDPPKYEPGTHHYSNFGYILLGNIAAQVSGKSYEQLAREEIFEPLGMKSAGFGVPTGNAPLGHRGGKPADKDMYPKEFTPAGRIHANVSDWLKFLKYEMAQERVLHPNYTVIAPKEFGGGHYTDSALRINDDGSLSHGGSNGLNKSRQVLLPDRNATIAIVTNEVGIATNGIDPTEAALDEVAAYVKNNMIQPPTLERTRQSELSKSAPPLEPHAFSNPQIAAMLRRGPLHASQAWGR